MTGKQSVTIVTYNGIDGACAAAMVLLKHPSAEVRITSARRIGQTLAEAARPSPAPGEVHVCGVGVDCDWEEVSRSLESLRRKKAAVVWYCGRGYLDDRKDAFAGVCTPVFLDADTNTAAVCKSLGLAGAASAQFLCGLALRDPRVGMAEDVAADEEAFEMDFIDASIAQYFKYQDTAAYEGAIRKLARRKYDAADARMVEIFRRTGYKYVLEGRSEQMRELRRKIGAFARLDESVVITGEPGVGKEYVARLIHEGSSRATEPFVPINCAVFCGNTSLANSMLFGHVKGAFTGAEQARKGAFATANGGILFLDEVGEMPLDVQPKLLRVLEDGMVTPEGADAPAERVNVRVIAATNRDLTAMVRDREFRADLYHRLDTFRLPVPSLRERTEDIAAIAGITLQALSEQGHSRRLPAKDLRLLQSYDWPGNVRQLIKLLKRCAYLKLSVADALKEERRMAAKPGDAGSAAGFMPRCAAEIRPLKDVEREYARKALELTGGNITETARLLGIAKNTLKKMARG